MIDCFTRFALALPIPDQLTQTIISTVLGSYILYYATPRRILTDQGRNFESSEFISFLNLFRIFKIRTTAYHPQANGVCERFNQTLKFSLRKIFSESQRDSWDLNINFAVFSYNTSIHSSTGFTPFYLTVGSEARLPANIIFGNQSNSSLSLSKLNSPAHGASATRGAFSDLLNSFELLSRAFASFRENFYSFHQREKDSYDLGPVSRVFSSGHLVRVRLKSRQKGPAKFSPEWSGPHEVLKVQGVVVTLQEVSSGREYKTHHDRLSNPILSHPPEAQDVEKDELPSSNPTENVEEPEPDAEPIGDSAETLILTRYGRTVRPPKDKNFVYMLPVREPQTSSSPLITSLLMRASAALSTVVCLRL